MTQLKYSAKKPSTIRSMFDKIATRYDLGNAVLSFQMHRIWNAKLVKLMTSNKKDSTLLDLCCGTGDIAYNFLTKNANNISKTFLIDFSEEMLKCAQEKAKKKHLSHHDLSFIHGDAMDIPLPDTSVDLTTIAYGIRNIEEPAVCAQEVFRVLKPHGKIGILELTRPNSLILKTLHKQYLRIALPILGKTITSNEEAYQYLSQSVSNFTSPVSLSEMLQGVGFKDITITPLMGGIATIITGTKPK
jgi:demethylmenaquinone methyltransferase / 2-methoxy-6-polyprenyl-1,4-benzoquinol methylase